MRQLGLRLLQLIPVLFLVTLATFLITELLPGDPAIAILGENATPAQIEAVRKDLHLDKPVVSRYATWLGDAPCSTSTAKSSPASCRAIAPSPNVARSSCRARRTATRSPPC